jgi:hypothetical protein
VNESYLSKSKALDVRLDGTIFVTAELTSIDYNVPGNQLTVVERSAGGVSVSVSGLYSPYSSFTEVMKNIEV